MPFKTPSPKVILPRLFQAVRSPRLLRGRKGQASSSNEATAIPLSPSSNRNVPVYSDETTTSAPYDNTTPPAQSPSPDGLMLNRLSARPGNMFEVPLNHLSAGLQDADDSLMEPFLESGMFARGAELSRSAGSNSTSSRDRTLGDFAVNDSGSRFSEYQGEDDKADESTMCPEHISFAPGTRDSSAGHPLTRVPTPSLVLTPAAALARADPSPALSPANSFLTGDNGETAFLQLQDDLQEGLLLYFSKWTVYVSLRPAQRLRRAARSLALALRELALEMPNVPSDLAATVEQIDMDLRVCLGRARHVHSIMTRRNRSAVGPLQGKERCWRRHMIKTDLAPYMSLIAADILDVQVRVEDITRQVFEAREGYDVANETWLSMLRHF